MKKSLGQITTRKIGSKWVVCISGNPIMICKDKLKAIKKADMIRSSNGRRTKRR